MQPWLLTLSCTYLALGCATAGPGAEHVPQGTTTQVTAPHQPDLGIRLVHDPNVSSDSIDAPTDSAWAVLPAVYQDLAIPVTVRDPAVRQLGNSRFRPRRIGGSRLSAFLECGRGVTAVPYADQYQVTMLVLTTLQETGGGGTMLRTQVEASAKPRSVSGNPLHCSSKRTLENRIATLLLVKLAETHP